MKTVAAVLAFAAAVVAVPQAGTSFSPAEATLELFSALPSSIAALALTNPAAASTAIAEQFATGTPTWFTVLPSDVQSYFLGQQAPSLSSGGSVPLTTGSSNSTASVTGKFLNSTTTSTGSKTSTSTSSGSSSKASAASSSSSGAASIPTAIIGGGLAGVVGLVGMLAL